MQPSCREEIERLLAVDLTLSEIARRLGVARPTVEYHAQRIANTSVKPALTPIVEAQALEPRSEVPTRRLVRDLLRQGFSRIQIAKQLGISKATVSYHARRLGAPVDTRCARRYDWGAIQVYYDQGHSMRACRAQFGFSSHSWHEAVKRGAIVSRPAKLASEAFFARGAYRNRTYLKTRLLAEGHAQPRCNACALSRWQGQALSLALHHINGDRDDNRVANLELLCPNCHSQTETFSGRNAHRRRARPRPDKPALRRA